MIFPGGRSGVFAVAVWVSGMMIWERKWKSHCQGLLHCYSVCYCCFWSWRGYVATVFWHKESATLLFSFFFFNTFLRVEVFFFFFLKMPVCGSFWTSNSFEARSVDQCVCVLCVSAVSDQVQSLVDCWAGSLSNLFTVAKFFTCTEMMGMNGKKCVVSHLLRMYNLVKKKKRHSISKS